ncbi:TPA: hypothetical protein ACH3X1_009228 [Trebouxia sp. C0004]
MDLDPTLQQDGMHISSLHSTSEFLGAQNDWKVDQLQQHVSGQQQECSHLKAQLRAAQKGERGEQRRQALAAAAKDAKLSQLRRNMQGLEAKLIHAMQSDAHRHAVPEIVCGAAAKDTGQKQLQKALQENAQLQVTIQKVQAEVRELQFQGMLASSSSSQDSTPAAGKAQPCSTGCDASKPATDSTPSARRGNADSAAAAAAVGTVGGVSAEDTAEQPEGRGQKGYRPKGGPSTGLAGQFLSSDGPSKANSFVVVCTSFADCFTVSANSGLHHKSKDCLMKRSGLGTTCNSSYASSWPVPQATAPAEGPTADQQGQEVAQHQVTKLQQQLAALEYKLQQAESSQGSVKQPLQEQQLPENLSGKAPQKPVMAEAVADASYRPHWQNPMAVHLSEAEKAEWEEKKKLQKRIDQLRAKLREKSVLVEQLQKEKQKKGEQVQQAHADLARQAALIKDLQAHARGKKELKEGGASLDQVRELMLIDSLEEQRGALERQVATRQQPAAADQLAPPGSTTASDLPLQDQLLFKESELVEARLERSQAEAQRAQQRLDDILAQQPAPQALGIQVGSQRGEERSKQGLVDTIQGLQRALERSRKECQAAVSSAPPQSSHESHAAAAGEVEGAEQEVQCLRRRSTHCSRHQRRGTSTGAALPADPGCQCNPQETAQALQEGHFQAKALSDQVRGTAVHKGYQAKMLRSDRECHPMQLKERLALIETENADMRSAFDPAFFDEIEDLKYDHHQLQLQCTEYDSIVRELSAQLGIDAAVLAKLAG